MVLRTTTEIMTNALRAMELCANDWPEYQADYQQMKAMVERLELAAQGMGYVGKKRR